MELKEFQTSVLNKFEYWLKVLEEQRKFSEELVKEYEKRGEDTSDVSNYPKKAWEKMFRNDELPFKSPYIDRNDGTGKPIPHVCLKVPTGGGKTLLAATSLDRMSYNRGLVLWIVPSDTIYKQTLKVLRNNTHHVRTWLNRAACGNERVKILEKATGFNRNDLRDYLCVMVLTYQSFNRKRGRDVLKMTQSGGQYMSFFPPAGDIKRHDELLEKFPDLDKDGAQAARSLVNVIKMQRPVVILDEAHKTKGGITEDEYSKTVSELDPRMVVELSATPYSNVSNILVNVTGAEMDAEEMIKGRISLSSFDGDDWRYTLGQGHKKLGELAADSVSLRERDGRYIRPIAVVRVERTGKEMRDGEIHIHTEDVREYLLKLGVRPEEIAVKSTAADDLSDKKLLSEDTLIRWIITKSALMEGWDCSFAYVLIVLDNVRKKLALTQLLGRVLRQPHVRHTDITSLDTCYVFCHHTGTEESLQAIRSGLEGAGMGDLNTNVLVKSEKMESVYAERRRDLKSDIFMPKVLHSDGKKWNELDYEKHILANVKWNDIQMPDLTGYDSRRTQSHETVLDVGGRALDDVRTETITDDEILISDFVAPLSSVMPNAWHAARLVREWLDGMKAAGKDAQHINSIRPGIISHMKEHIENEITNQAEAIFGKKVKQRKIRFDLEVAERNFRLAKKYAVDGAGKPFVRDVRPMQRTLFEPVLDEEFDTDPERSFAQYLDQEEAMRWWHKVAHRQSHEYYIRGWKPDRIWPDFIAMVGKENGEECVLIYEIKGRHLENPDTEYKRKVLEKLEDAFNCGMVTVRGGKLKGRFRIILEDKFPPVCCEE